MVQTRLFRKHNPDSHYCNAIYNFMKERAMTHRDTSALFSVDAKCKDSVGEPDFPIASVTRDKKVIVGKMVCYHCARASALTDYSVNFPQCARCNNKPKVWIPKRKAVNQVDLTKNKKQKQ